MHWRWQAGHPTGRPRWRRSQGAGCRISVGHRGIGPVVEIGARPIAPVHHPIIRRMSGRIGERFGDAVRIFHSRGPERGNRGHRIIIGDADSGIIGPEVAIDFADHRRHGPIAAAIGAGGVDVGQAGGIPGKDLALISIAPIDGPCRGRVSVGVVEFSGERGRLAGGDRIRSADRKQPAALRPRWSRRYTCRSR